MTIHHFSDTVVWSRLGPFVTTAENLHSRSVTLPAGGNATVVQNGVTQVGYLIADANGTVTFTTTDIPIVIADFGSGPMRLVSAEAVGAGGGGAGTVTSVNSLTPDGAGNVVIDAAHVAGIATVGKTGAYGDLTGAPGTRTAIQGNAPGPLVVGQIWAGGIRVDYPFTLTAMVCLVDIESVGADITVQLLTMVRTTGVTTLQGTATITQGTSRRGVLSGLSVSMTTGDIIFVQVTQTGTTQPGSDLKVSMLGANATIPTALSAPAAPTAFTVASATAGADVQLTWTAPASGVYFAVDIYQDGAWLTRITKGTNSFLDVGSGPDPHTYSIEAVNTDAVSTSATASYVPTTGVQFVGFLGGSWIGSGASVVMTAGSSGTGVTPAASSSAVPAGDYVVVAVGISGTGSSVAVTDSKGNTYTQVGYEDNPTSSTMQAGLYYCKVAAGKDIDATTTITATVTAAPTIKRYWILAGRVTGIVASSPLDSGATVANPSTVSNKTPTAGPTSTLAQAAEFAFGSIENGGTTVSAGGSFNLAGGVITTAGTNERSGALLYQITAATTPLTMSASTTVNSHWAAVLGALKGA